MDMQLMATAIDGFEQRLRAVDGEEWSGPTPCADWDVRALVNHVVGELLWIPPLLEGRTIAEVGDRFDGDVLGEDPVATLVAAAAGVIAAGAPDGVQDRIVNLSYGDFPAGEYLGQVASDVIIHTWDLARAVGCPDRLEPALVDFVTEFLTPQIEAWRNADVFGPPVGAGPEADRQDQFIAQTGRSPEWMP